MAHLRILVVLVLAVFGYATIIDSAAVDSEDFPKLENTYNVSQPQMLCDTMTPCGWAIYIPSTKKIDYFMKNKCICMKSQRCEVVYNETSVNAYVYRCAQKPVSEVAEASPSGLGWSSKKRTARPSVGR